MTNGEIAIMLLIFSANAWVLGTTRYARSFLVIAFHLVFAGVAGFFCRASATGSGSTVDTVTFGLLALLSGVMTLLELSKPRRW